MKRCYLVSKGFLKFLDEQEGREVKRPFSLTWERIHSLGSARAASVLAAKRGIDVELAYAAGVLHDFGRIVTRRQEDHALNGYEPVQEFLKALKIFKAQEIREIALAVKSHSSKALLGTPLEEIAKDCDVLDSFLLGIAMRTEKHVQRLHALQKELGFSGN